jgi:hypothetical protein
MAQLLSAQQDVVQRLVEVPGLGADSAQQIIAEVGVGLCIGSAMLRQLEPLRTVCVVSSG